MRRTLLALTFVLLTAGSVHAQWGGSGGHGHGGHGRQPDSDSQSSAPSARQSRTQAPVPADQVVITGVVRSFGPEPDRVTISYDAVEALAWPAGTMPFVVTNPSLLTGVTVGEKVRFKIESAHIYAIDPAKQDNGSAAP